MNSVYSFRYMLADSFCAFLSFRELVLFGFFLLHLEAVFMSARFFLTANASHGTLGLALLVGMHSAATSKWTLTKLSYSSFRLCVSFFSCSASNLLLSVNVYLSLICLLLSWDQLLCTVVVVRVAFLPRLSRIFAEIIRWSEGTPLKDEYAPQFNALLFHFYFFFYKDEVYLCFSIICVGVNLFSSVKSVRCSPFLFDKLCKLNLWFTFLPIWAFMPPPMTRTLCFGMLRTRGDDSLEKTMSSVSSLTLAGL